MHRIPLTWYEQENLGHKAPQSTVIFESTLVVRCITKALRVGPTGR